jgi:ABC-type antimicrobial peptide transport system permease subunit
MVAIASISLLVGGIGIMNIMLASLLDPYHLKIADLSK